MATYPNARLTEDGIRLAVKLNDGQQLVIHAPPEFGLPVVEYCIGQAVLKHGLDHNTAQAMLAMARVYYEVGREAFMDWNENQK